MAEKKEEVTEKKDVAPQKEESFMVKHAETASEFHARVKVMQQKEEEELLAKAGKAEAKAAKK